MGGGWFQVKAKMDSATNSGESLLVAHFMQMHEIVQGGTVNVTEQTLFALPCANVVARVMLSDLLNWNLLINLLDNWKSSP